MSTHIMLDLESLGTRINPVIAQISAVEFDITTGETFDIFNEFIDTNSCRRIGLTEDKSTMEFWLSPENEKAFNMVFRNPKPSIRIEEACHNFTEFTHGKSVFLWGNGIRCDNVWLLSAYKALNMEDPIRYNQDLDFRTLYWLATQKTGKRYKDMLFEGIRHNAVDDCKHQIKIACEMYKDLMS